MPPFLSPTPSTLQREIWQELGGRGRLKRNKRGGAWSLKMGENIEERGGVLGSKGQEKEVWVLLVSS